MTTIILTTDQVKARLFELLAKQQTPKFVSVKNYRNEKGELSDYVINVGVSYVNACQSDAEKLSDAANFADVDFGIVKAFSEEARTALLTALINPTEATLNRSKGQTDAYEQICQNIRLHLETGRIMVNGFKISKSVVEAIDYGPDKRKPLTIAKDKIRATLKGTKYRQYCLDKIVEVRMNGETLEFDLE